MPVTNIYAVETIDYAVKFKTLEVEDIVRDDKTGDIELYKLKTAVSVGLWHLSNLLSTSHFERDIELSHITDREYHVIRYFTNRDKAEKYQKLALTVRDSRLDNDILQAKSKVEYLEGIKANLKYL